MHIFTCCRRPSAEVTETFCTFTFQRRLVLWFEWLTLCPNWGPRPQMSHFAIVCARVESEFLRNEPEMKQAVKTGPASDIVTLGSNFDKRAAL